MIGHISSLGAEAGALNELLRTEAPANPLTILLDFLNTIQVVSNVLCAEKDYDLDRHRHKAVFISMFQKLYRRTAVTRLV